MPFTEKNGWVKWENPDPTHWAHQSHCFRLDSIVSVSSVKCIVRPNGPEDGINVVTQTDVFWMRFKDYDKARADYEELLAFMTEEK